MQEAAEFMRGGQHALDAAECMRAVATAVTAVVSMTGRRARFVVVSWNKVKCREVSLSREELSLISFVFPRCFNVSR